MDGRVTNSNKIKLQELNLNFKILRVKFKYLNFQGNQKYKLRKRD